MLLLSLFLPACSAPDTASDSGLVPEDTGPFPEDTDAPDTDVEVVPLDTAAEGFGIVINEVLVALDYNSPFDANCDGSVQFDADAFVEIVNIGTIDIELYGVSVSTEEEANATFRAAYVLPPGGVVVLFNGGEPDLDGASEGIEDWCRTPVDDDVLVSRMNISYMNRNSPCPPFEVMLVGPAGYVLDAFSPGDDLACRAGSYVRSPEFSRGGTYASHDDMSRWEASPGLTVDGGQILP